MRHVVMGRGDRAVADPDADQRRAALEPRMIEADAVLGAQARQIIVDIGRTDIEGGRVRPSFTRQDPLQELVEPDPAGFEIEAGDGVVVEEPAANLRLARVGHDRLAAVESKEIVGGRPRRFLPVPNQRPIPGRALEDHRLLRLDERVERDPIGRNALLGADLAGLRVHRRRLVQR